MNSGNQGRGAFSAWLTPTGMAGRHFTGQPLPDALAVETAWRELLELDNALIQPCLANHPELAPLSYNDDVITVRLISQWEDRDDGLQPTQLNCLSAMLEVPAGIGDQERLFYAILPITPENGALCSPLMGPATPPEMQAAAARIAKEAENLALLPFLTQMQAHSFLAHRRFTDVKSIAWDWVITPEGPLLLEGNTGWGLSVLQQHPGGIACANVT
jgi:hypothetical protein